LLSGERRGWAFSGLPKRISRGIRGGGDVLKSVIFFSFS
jgi:hypothetical protein